MCPFNSNGECKIANAVVCSIGSKTSPEACAVCVKSTNPQGVNVVTMSLAVKRCLEIGDKTKYDEIIRYFDQSQGPGTELKKVISWLYSPTKRCKCPTRIRKMNQWGVDGCWRRRDCILRWLKHSARIAKKPYIKSACKIAIALAVRTARRKQERFDKIIKLKAKNG